MAKKKINVVLSLAADKGTLLKTVRVRRRKKKSRRSHRRHRRSRK